MCRKKTHEEYVTEVSRINKDIEVVGKYINAHTKILHRCKIDGYEWNADPSNIRRGKGCPVCAGKAVISGYNDLVTIRPDIAAEWNYNRNKNLLPTQFTVGSKEKVWWKCAHNHEWIASIDSRTHSNSSCPHCVKGLHVSTQETKIYYYIKKYFPDTISGYKDIDKGISEIDIFIPSLNVGIEYDGGNWHQNILKDKQKDDICKYNNIYLIRVRDHCCPQYESNCRFINLKDSSMQTLSISIKNILEFLGVDFPDVHFDRDSVEIENLIFQRKRNNSLAIIFPELAKEWHPTKNGNLTPENVTACSDKKIWWMCKEGHEYMAAVHNRTNNKSGCPKCGIKSSAKNRSKPIYCKELNRIFRSINDAAIEFNINSSAISAACVGRRKKTCSKHPITGEPLHWYYVYDKILKNQSVVLGAISLGYVTQDDLRRFIYKPGA